jgi:formylmethanofuran dehydrogenase subunit E
MKRNLLYNCCPFVGAEAVTRDNIAWLCHYGQIFNGRKIVNIKTGGDLEKPEVVRSLFADLGEVEFVEYRNVPNLGEYVGFLEGFEALKSIDKKEITFYAHTKGVGPRHRAPRAPKGHQEFVKQWYTKMYRHCLADSEFIDNVMYEHSAAGCYRIRRYEGGGRWIFAGAFYWVNHFRLFSNKDWDRVRADKWTPEAYFLSQAFDWKDTFDLYTRITVNCRRCGRYNYAPEEPIDPRFDICPACGRKSLYHAPIVPGDLDDELDKIDNQQIVRKPNSFRRNLIYNCCPVKGAEAVTRDNIAWLVKYAKTFNGRKLINLKTGDNLEASADIRPLFAVLGEVEFYEYPNDPAIGEYVGFLESFDRLYSIDPREATFYGHTKGVSAYNLGPERRFQSIRQWYRRMYHECLSDPDRIDKAMASFAACGAFYKKRPIPHFSGAFYWVNHAKLFNKPQWDHEPEPNAILDQFTRSLTRAPTERKRFFVEMYLGVLFDAKEFYDLHPIQENFNLYVMPYRLYNCRKCGDFAASGQGHIICPKCKGSRPTMMGWPELGF